jgi:aspartyl protease family protein
VSFSKYSVPVIVALALGAPVLIGMRDNSIHPAEAKTEIVTLQQQALASLQDRAPSQAELYAAAAISSARSVTLPMEDGHYWADAKVNSAQVHFLVDTGASVVALTKQDARRIGVNIRSAGQFARMSTANGEITVPLVTLKRIRIGNVEVTNVDAVVIEEGLSTSLLGMSFLSQLKTWQTTPAGLVLKQ